MHLKRLVTFLVLYFILKSLVAQHVDTNLVVRHIKFNLFGEVELGLLSEDALRSYARRDLQVDILPAKGFDHIVFFRIEGQILATDTILGTGEIIIHSTPPCLKGGEKCYFVYAYNRNSERLYRLKGTVSNDFREFYDSLQWWEDWTKPEKIGRKAIKNFTNVFWVKGLDLKCLLKSLRTSRGNCLDYFSPGLSTY